MFMKNVQVHDYDTRQRDHIMYLALNQDLTKSICDTTVLFFWNNTLSSGVVTIVTTEISFWRWRAEGTISPLQSQPTKTSYRNDRF